jgi:hypothetical protein
MVLRYSQWGKTVYYIFDEPDFTHDQIGIDRSVCLDSDWRSPTRYEIESDHRTGVNFKHWRSMKIKHQVIWQITLTNHIIILLFLYWNHLKVAQQLFYWEATQVQFTVGHICLGPVVVHPDTASKTRPRNIYL